MMGSDKEQRIQRMIRKRMLFHRLRTGITQTQVGAVVGCSFQQVQKYEDGRNRVPSPKLMLMSELFKVPIGELFGEGSSEPCPSYSDKLLAIMNDLASLELKAPEKFKLLSDLVRTAAAAER